MQGRTRDVRAHATAHHFETIVQRQAKTRPQFHRDRLLGRVEGGLEAMRTMGAILGRYTPLPTPDRRLADAQFRSQFRDRGLALLDVGPNLRRGRGIRV